MTALPRSIPRSITRSITRRTRRLGLLLATGLLGTAALAGCSSDDTTADDPGDGGQSSTTPTAQSESPTADPSSSGSPSDDATADVPADTVAVPLYFVGDTPQGTRLYREFQRVETDNPLAEAAARVLGGQVVDPDYRSLWPSSGIGEIVEEGDRIVVTLAPDSTLTDAGDLSPVDAKLAVQQLVYTLEGVTGTRDRVFVQSDDGSPSTLLGLDTTMGLPAAKQLNVLALVNVTDPAEGATVSGTFTADGVASSFEGTVPWEIRQGDTVVASGFATAEGYVDKLYPWTTDIDVSDLPAGDYTFAALTDDPSGGEGPGPTEDTKAITVR